MTIILYQENTALMPTIILVYIAVALRFVSLIWSANHFVTGSTAVAKDMGVYKLMIHLIEIGH
jgi:hypothetical protein